MSNSRLSKTKILKEEILSKIEEHLSNDLLLNDIENFLNELNWWKISTLNKNLDSFLTYIDDILSELDENDIEKESGIQNNKHKQEKTQKKDFLSITDEDYIQKINKIRGFFWLTVTEFTQGRNSNLVLKYRKLIEK